MMIIGLSLETMGRMSFANGWWRAVCWMMHTYLLSKMLLFSRNQQIFFDHCQDRSATPPPFPRPFRYAPWAGKRRNRTMTGQEVCCPCCKSKHVIRSGYTMRTIRSIPIGHKQVKLHVKVRRVECKECGAVRQERIHFVTGKRTYTNRFCRLVVELSRIGTIKDVAFFLHVGWDTVKNIQKFYLARHYGSSDLSSLEYIGIDEFAVSKGHVYKTIVVNLINGQVVYIGDGKGKEALEGFWEKVKKGGVALKAVATDLSSAFIASVMENAPHATLVFDHFHVVKLMNEVLDEVRRNAYREEKDLNKRKVIKGTRWLLLCNGRTSLTGNLKTGWKTR